MNLYRYNLDLGEEFEDRLFCGKFEVVRQTQMCYVIRIMDKDKFILKSQGGKRFAYDSKKTALESYIIRKKRQKQILKSQLRNAKRGLELAKIKLAQNNF